MGKAIGWAVIALVICVISGASVLASVVITGVGAVIGAFG